TFEILVDNQKGENYFGKTRTLKNVMFKSDKKNLIGNFIKVKIIKVTSWNLEGKIYAK
ncbi:MAG: TRAM domain-containing protein, partial [Candidatus Moranbacteria bacterium]|nr:TRAM domain-containing protein [Candidatus Moranbacteria bacterium]